MPSSSVIPYLLIAAAGVGFLATLIINAVNDWLLKKRWSVIHPDTMISIDVFKIMNPIESMKKGLYSLFVGGWIGTFVFLLLWITPFYQGFAGGSVWIGAAVYCFAIYIVMMLIFLPLVHRGFFGVLYHPRTPYWSFALIALYAVLLGLLVPLVI
jgi:hypothetical protein